MKAVLFALVLLASCQTVPDDDPGIPPDVLCAVVTCRR